MHPSPALYLGIIDIKSYVQTNVTINICLNYCLNEI